MVWLSRFLAGRERQPRYLTETQKERIALWRQLPEPELGRSHYRSRYLVIDIALAGSDWKSGPLGSIGALALVDGLIDLNDALHLVLRSGVAAEAGLAQLAGAGAVDSLGGDQRIDGLLDLLSFLGKAPLVAYHAPFVARRFERALVAALGVELRLPWIDLAWVMAGLFRDFGDKPAHLDDWLGLFAIDSIARHQPLSDAYACAQLLQITLARAAHKGFETPASLLELEKARRYLYQSG